ncbi:MAG: DUF2617 domain-containing protein [Planctomycetota bacterium]
MLSVRPKVAELAFHLFSRPLHPELISVHQSRTVQREAYRARTEITNCGHVITFTAEQLHEQTSQDISGHGGEQKAATAGQASGNEDSIKTNDTASTSIPATLCEVATGVHQPLPSKRCLLRQPLQGSRTENVRCRNGVCYRTHFQLETVEPKMFWMVGQQLGKQPTEGLMHTFDSSGRMALGAISYLNIETRRRSMLVQAIHTFPDDYAIVKVESLFSLPESN